MQRLTLVLIFLLIALSVASAPAHAWLFGGGNTLLTIDGKSYSADDFKQWWQFWNDEDLPLPETPDVYIDWLLLSREGASMELASTPGVRRQSEVYLKSRALLMLKNEAVNSRIEVTEDDIRAQYELKYLPRWLVQRLDFRDVAAATVAWEELNAGKVSIETLAARDPEQGGPIENRESWQRPVTVDPWWSDVFDKMGPGEMIGPGEFDEAFPNRIVLLKDVKDGDDEDLAALREGISSKVWKMKENQLTLDLLERLRQKYEVEVDFERIEAIDLMANPEDLSDEFVITTNQKNVSEKAFLAIVRRHIASRGVAAHAFADKVKALETKREVVDGIINQNVTDWEAIDRHYEEQVPFKHEYDFFVAHQLVLALEKRLFAAEAEVTEDEIKRYYEQNQDRYKQLETAKLYIIDDTQGPVKQVWAEVLSGVPFLKAARQHAEINVVSQEVPVNHIDPEIKAMVDKMVDGETSPLFVAQGSQVLVHLEERVPSRPLPLAQVSSSIRNQLIAQKIAQQRRAYLDLLKSRSHIEVHNRQWQTIRKELGGV